MLIVFASQNWHLMRPYAKPSTVKDLFWNTAPEEWCLLPTARHRGSIQERHSYGQTQFDIGVFLNSAEKRAPLLSYIFAY